MKRLLLVLLVMALLTACIVGFGETPDTVVDIVTNSEIAVADSAAEQPDEGLTEEELVQKYLAPRPVIRFKQEIPEETEVPLLGGTKEFPEFRGIRMGEMLFSIIAREESRGVELMGPDVMDYSFSRERTYTATVHDQGDEVEISYTVAGKKHLGWLYGATATYPPEAADRLRAQITELYGEPDQEKYEECWNVGYGFQWLGRHSRQEDMYGMTGTLVLSSNGDSVSVSLTMSPTENDAWKTSQE